MPQNDTPMDGETRHAFQMLQSPAHWYQKAATLRRNARVLYSAELPRARRFERARAEASRTIDRTGRSTASIRAAEPDLLPAFMMYGLSLENFGKGLLIARNPSLIRCDRIAPEIFGHDVLKPIRRLGFAMNEQERQALDWLAEVVKWRARYPCPVHSQTDDEIPLGALELSEARRIKPLIEGVCRRLASQLRPHASSRSRYSVLVSLDPDIPKAEQ